MASRLAIIGAGNMAEAIARGLLGSNVYATTQLIAADVVPARRELFQTQLGIETTDSPALAVQGASIVLVSVKPQNMKDALVSMRDSIDDDALVISIAAGTGTRMIEANLAPRRCRVVRVMPNTPMLIGEGMVAIAPGARASAEDLRTARSIFEPAASVIEVSEDKLDAVTALSGSGPAYFFYLVEQIISAGVEMGLTESESRTLATKTALGAARMLAESGESASELRRKVTSPNGTTHAAITHMESNRMDRTIIDALKAAQRRGRELGAQ